VSYGVHIAVVSYALYVLRRLAFVEPASPGWISLRLLTWSAAALSGTAAVITWLHASGLQNALDARALPAIVYAVLYVGYSIWKDHHGGDNINHSAHLWGAAYGVMCTLLVDPDVLGSFMEKLAHPSFG